MKVDLHFHFRHRKDDRDERLRQMVARAQECDVRGIALLDHNYFPSDENLDVARKAAPLITFWRACELDIIDEARGVKSHMVVVSDAGLPFDISRGLTTQNIPMLTEAAQAEGVLTMLAHPFRHNRMHIAFDLHQFKPDLIDAIGRTANQEKLRKVATLASAFGMGLASASDSHETRHVGRHWINFQNDAKTVVDLKTMVSRSQYSLVAGS
jgi:predicted metal-dependent phosphoesterase TrpH